MKSYEMSTSEIAEQLGISERTVGHILRKALAKLHGQPQLWADFCTLVREKRLAVDARSGNIP